MKERINWIDTAKGIGIILVILGHISFRPNILNIWLCSFHMSLFFFLAGITYNPKKYDTFKPLLISKIKTLVIPYFVFAIVMWLWKFFMQLYTLLRTGNQISLGYLFRQGIGIFINIRESAFGPGVWFVTCIFIAFLMLYAIMKLSKGKKAVALIIATAFFIAGYLYCEFIDIKLPWAIDAATVAVFFMAVGCVFRDKLLSLQKPKLFPAAIRGGYFYC